MRYRSGYSALAITAIALVLSACSSSPAAAPAAVKGFDEAGVSVGTGNAYSAADWRVIKGDGFRLFLTDPIRWSSECSDNNCTQPVGHCIISPPAVAQLQLALAQGIDYAVYTRNPHCLTAAIRGLTPELRAHLSFAVLDIENGPSVPLTSSLINGVTALGQTPVVYSFHRAWADIMHGSTAFSGHPLQDGQVPDFSAQFPAAYPAGFPKLVPMPVPYGGWSGYADLEQQQCCAQITGPAGTLGAASDQVNLDAVSQSWLDSLPHHA